MKSSGHEDILEQATLSIEMFREEEQFKTLDIGAYDYVLKCIDGSYLSKFIYLNTANEEIIGGADDYNVITNPSQITMYVENSKLEERHASISFNQHCQYILKDLNDWKKSSGIWIKIPMIGEGIDLTQKNHMKREYQLEKGKYKFHFEDNFQTQNNDEIQQWLQKKNLQFASKMVLNEKIEKFEDLYKLHRDIFNNYKFSEEQQTQLMTQIKELSLTNAHKQGGSSQSVHQIPTFSDNQMASQRTLSIVFTEGIQGKFRITPANPFVLVSSDLKDKIQNDVVIEGPKGVSIIVEIKQSCVFLRANIEDHQDPESIVSAFYRLYHNEEFVLQPGDIIQMGTQIFQIQRFNVGVVADIGNRNNMEDTYVSCHDLNIDEFMKASLYSVIDGHGGEMCANYLKRHLVPEMRKNLTNLQSGVKTSQVSISECIERAMKTTFLNLDENFHRDMNDISFRCGAAAVVVLIIGSRVYCANVGDSRAIMSHRGKAINLSVDHKTSRQDEAQRVRDGGGTILGGRIESRLAISRAFGDFEFKIHFGPNGQQVRRKVLIAEPEVRQIDLDLMNDEFIVVASDGLYDKFSSQEAVNYIREKLGVMPYREQDCQKVARDIVNESIYTRHVRDNVTAIIIALNRGVKLNQT